MTQRNEKTKEEYMNFLFNPIRSLRYSTTTLSPLSTMRLAPEFLPSDRRLSRFSVFVVVTECLSSPVVPG